MRRLQQLPRFALALVAFVVAVCGIVLADGATRTTLPRHISAPATAPPLPLGDQAKSVMRRNDNVGALNGRSLVLAPGARRLRKLSLREVLAHATNVRRIRTATGATITMLGDHTGFVVNNAPQVADFTVGYGQQISFTCSNLTANEANLKYIILPPDGSAFQTGPTVSTDANGNCLTNLVDVTMSTPYGSGTDAPYAGVWAVAMQQSGGNYEAVTYFAVTSEPTLSTYRDGALNQPTKDFRTGDTMYVVANNLTSSDHYAIGWVYTGLPPISCVNSVPAAHLANSPNCFSKTAGNAGVTASTGSFEGAWATSAAQATGTYTIQLYDVTTNHLLASQAVSLESATSTSVWTITKYGANTLTPVNQTINDNTFATDGLTEQSVTGLGGTITNLTAGDMYVYTINDPGGAALNSGVNSTYHPQTVVFPAISSTLTAPYTAFPLNAGRNTAVGPSQLLSATNYYNLMLYDRTAGNVTASKSVRLVGYSAAFDWSGGAASYSGGGNTCGNATTNTVNVTNTGDSTYGAGNGDGIIRIHLRPDVGGSVLLCNVNAAASDSAGHSWTITSDGGSGFYVTINQVQASDALPVGGLLTFQIGLAGPSSICGNGCSLQTAITPLHGVDESGKNTVTNGLLVGGKNVNGSPLGSTLAWAVGTPPPVPIAVSPPFTQAMYLRGTNASTVANKYILQATVTNNNAANTADKINDVAFTFPASYDFSGTNAPTLSGVTIGGSSVAGWQIYTAATSTHLTNTNTFMVGCAAASAPQTPCATSLNSGGTAVFTISLPMPANSFALQQIAASANFAGGCAASGVNCTFTVTPVYATGTQSTVAGPTGVDSTELGVYSLDPTKMAGVFAPSTIGAGVATSTTWTFTNTPLASDPNPDYVNQIKLTFPTNATPTSVSAPTGWTVAGSGTSTVTVSTACVASTCGGVAAQDAYAIAPSGTLALSMTFTNPVAASYTGNGGIAWQVRGANGGAVTTGFGYSDLIVSPVAATVKFAGAGGYPAASITGSGEPFVGSDSNSTFGNAFDYKITNSGSQTIKSFTIRIPATTRSGLTGQDNGAPAQGWNITNISTPAGCSAPTVTQPIFAPVTDGVIDVRNCSLAPGSSLDVLFDAKAPYQIGSDFDFSADVCGAAATPPCTALNGVVGASSPTTGEYMQIVADARLSIVYSTAAIPAVGGATGLPNPTTGGATPNTSCPGCTFFAVGTSPGVDFGFVSGLFTATDLYDAQVISDANSPNSWTLSASYAYAPTTGTYTDTFQMAIDNSAGTMPVAARPAGYTQSGTAFFTPPVTPAAGTTIGTYTGSARRLPIDSVQSFKLNPNGDATSRTFTITYTLIVN